MRSIIVFIMVLVIFSCDSTRNKENKINKLVINGIIENYSNEFILITSPEYIGKRSYSTQINDTGYFHTSFPVGHYHDILLKFDDQFVTLLNKPKDSVFIHYINKDSIVFSGNNAETIRDLQQLKSIFIEDFKDSDIISKEKKLSADKFKEYVYSFSKNAESEIQKYSQTINATEDAQRWIKTFMICQLTDELFEYGFHNRNAISKDYFNYIKEYPINPDKASICSEFYMDYANNYLGYKVNTNDKYRKLTMLYRNQKYYNALDRHLELVSKDNTKNFMSELLVTQYFARVLKDNYQIVDSLIPRYTKIVDNKKLKTQLKNELTSLKLAQNESRTLEQLSKEKFVGNIFKQIIHKHSGEVLYIDFWSPMCSPCIKQFSHANRLHESLKGKNISFVYLCFHSDSTRWKNMRKKHQLKGTHFLLNRQQVDFIKSYFEFSGIPRYMIVNKEGEIVDEDAPRPNSNYIYTQLK
ncbi:MAG: thioredoxin family protein [Bacteroidales bacterium]|nr:thioredoxin family protein [Bacteroidales bacterium]